MDTSTRTPGLAVAVVALVMAAVVLAVTPEARPAPAVVHPMARAVVADRL
jgi:hypothetical protein